MKQRISVSAALIILFSVALLDAQEIDKNELARNTLTKVLNVQPGELVVIHGGKHTLDLLEAFAIETYRLGASPVPVFTSDKIERLSYELFPEDQIDKLVQSQVKYYNAMDVMINLIPWFENEEEALKGLPEEKIHKMDMAIASINLDTMNIRGVNVFYPTLADSKKYTMDFETYSQMIWKAINTDYTKISDQAKKLENMLVNSEKVEIASPAGTKISFSVKGRNCFKMDCVIDSTEAESHIFMERWGNVPEGLIYTSIIETSGNGKFICPAIHCEPDVIKIFSSTVKNGKMTDIKADENQDCFFKTWNKYSSPKDMIAGLSIGLNPELKMTGENAYLQKGSAAGMVYISFGHNYQFGGENEVDGMYSAWFPVSNATLKIDGVVVIKDGELLLE
ncbi:MAG: aminopeptidase [Bacteroidales bacterium]